MKWSSIILLCSFTRVYLAGCGNNNSQRSTTLAAALAAVLEVTVENASGENNVVKLSFLAILYIQFLNMVELVGSVFKDHVIY